MCLKLSLEITAVRTGQPTSLSGDNKWENVRILIWVVNLLSYLASIRKMLLFLCFYGMLTPFLSQRQLEEPFWFWGFLLTFQLTLIVTLPTPSQSPPSPMDCAHKSPLCLTCIARIWRTCYRFEREFVADASAGDIIRNRGTGQNLGWVYTVLSLVPFWKEFSHTA